MTHSFHPFPTLTTERLQLRALVPEDIETIFLLRSHPEVIKYINRPPAQTIEEARTFYDMIAEQVSTGKSINWAISLIGEKEMMGSICLWNFSEDLKTIEIGYDLLPTYQGKGYMSEALAAIVKYGIDVLSSEKIEAYTSKYNEPSKRLLQKHGFTLQSNRIDEHDPNNIIYQYLRK